MSQNAVPGARLVALDADVVPQEYELSRERCTIGRSAMCHVVVRNRAVVSRLHATIRPQGPRYLLEDSNSANGTYVNSARIDTPYLLQHKDVLGLGLPTPLLRFADADPTDEVAPRLTYDAGTMTLYVDGKALQTSVQQFKLLFHLFQHAGQLCTRESCAKAIWGREYDPGVDAGALDRAISNLRNRLREAATGQFIETRRGLGYVLHLNPRDESNN